MKALYTTKSLSTGGRDGSTRSEDGKLDLALSVPKELGGPGGDGTNPEQLFACGYSACFIGAIKFVAEQDKIKVSPDISIEATVGIGLNTEGEGFSISVDMLIDIPGMEKAAAEALVAKAHLVCPYSNATRNNIPVTLTIK